MNNYESYEAFFLLKGNSVETKNLCTKFLERSDISVVVEDGKLMLSSKDFESSSISDHIGWLFEQLKDSASQIKQAVDNGDFISFTYFYPKSKTMADILEPNISKILYEMNAPLHIHQR